MSRHASYSHPSRPPNPLTDSPERSPKGKKPARARTRAERVVGTEEERFNVGPRPARTVTPARTGGSRRHLQRSSRAADRPYLGDINDSVPNYPPPSFQEAISTPALSVCQSTVTLIPASPMSALSPLLIPGSPGTPQDSSTPVPRQRELDSAEYDSDDSLMLVVDDEAVPVGVDMRLVRSVKQDYRVRQGEEFPSPDTPAGHSDERHESFRTTPERGRPRLDLKAIYDAPDPAPRSPTISTHSKRFLSFSPLRAIFHTQPESPPVADRPHSAHPSPGASPYSNGAAKNSTFFRSTTSLATASFLRLPLASSASKPDNFFTRRLFSRGRDKSRDKSRDSHPAEALESWEELKADEIEDDTKKETNEEPPTQSLMPLVADVTRPEPIKTASPTRVTFADGPAPVSNEVAQVPTSLPTVEPEPQAQTGREEQAQSPQEAPKAVQPSVHPLSLRDRKTPLIQRPPRKKTPTPRVPIYVPPPPTDPILTTVRTRGQPNQLPGTTPPPSPPPPPPPTPPLQPLVPSKPSSAVSRPSPLGLESFSSEEAQDTSPVATHETIPIQAPVPARPVEDTPLICRCGSPDRQPSSPALSRVPSPLDDSTTPTRAHFVGRPLPRPPGSQSRHHIDSTFAPNVHLDDELSIRTSLSGCPEGLLIDLGETPAEEKDLASLFTNVPQRRSDSPPPLIDLDSSNENLPDRTSSPFNESGTLMPSLLPFSGTDDLAFLFSSYVDDTGGGRTLSSSVNTRASTEWRAAASTPALDPPHREGTPVDPGLYRTRSPLPKTICWRSIDTESHLNHQPSLLD